MAARASKPATNPEAIQPVAPDLSGERAANQPNTGEKNQQLVENVAATNPPGAQFGPDRTIDAREVSDANRDNWPGGGNPESPEFRRAAGLPVNAPSQVGDSPQWQAEPLFVVKTSFLNFQEGQHVTLSKVNRAGADPEWLLSNGSLVPLNAGGHQLMGMVQANGLPSVDSASHNQALEAQRAQLEDTHAQAMATISRERDTLKAERQHFDAKYNEIKAKADESDAKAKKVSEDASKNELRVMELEEENAELKAELESIRASKLEQPSE
jgi:hypothetical protein